MHIKDLNDNDCRGNREEVISVNFCRTVGSFDTKRLLIGAGARILFYPTLLYNVVRNKIQSEFRWWDEVDKCLLLGAVPFPADVPRLEHLGVQGVVTLNEAYETLVPTSLYCAYGIDHLVIPTRDYLFAPSFQDICRAVDFIQKNASLGKKTYVHCKAGRGRSTTVVLCFLVQHRQMTPKVAYEYVRQRRPRVLLAASQWQAVQEYYRLRVKKTGRSSCLDSPVAKPPAALVTTGQYTAFDDNSSLVMVTESDLDGYDGTYRSGVVGNDMWAELKMIYRAQFAGQAVLEKLSSLWVRSHSRQKLTRLGREKSCSIEADQLNMLGVDIPVH